jgi:hypothetical protein
MSTRLDESVSITLPKGTLLVVFEFLARSYVAWRGSGDKPLDQSFVLLRPDAGERVGLWRLEGVIESTLAEMFAPDYAELLSERKRQLLADDNR